MPKAKSKAPEQAHHYFASTAFNWAVAPTRAKAVEDVARMAGTSIIRGNVKARGGLYVWTCRVGLPQSAHYSINAYAPEFVHGEDGKPDRTKRVPISHVMEARIANTKGHVALED